MITKAEVLRGPFDPGGQPETRSGNPLEMGFFAWNIQGGMTASKAVLSDPDRYQTFWHWPNASEMVKEAERVGFEYQVPFARWIGQGGPTRYNDASLDGLSAAAALSPITSDLGLFSTCHITFKFHPLHFAKFGATIDHISGGRWGLNIVAGYAAREMAAFGMKEPIPHDEGYEMADEFTTLMKYLWTTDGKIDFEGKYYQAYGAEVEPKPTRKPRPVIMSAGNSPVGLDFGCRQSDWVFLTGSTLDTYKSRIKEVSDLSARYGRSVRPSTMIYVILDDTDEKANSTLEWLEEEVDKVAMANFLDSMKSNSLRDEYKIEEEAESDPWHGVDRETFMRLAMGISAWQIVGSYETAAMQIKELHDIGLESLLFCFLDPARGLQQTEEHLMPILKRMGLRN